MAGIAFWHIKYESLSNELVLEQHKQLGYKGGRLFEIGNWKILIFQKNLYEIQNWYQSGSDFIAAIGTFSYKKKFYEEALPTILSEFKNGTFDHDEIKGSFLIFAIINGNACLIRDGGLLMRIYKAKDRQIYFSSFVSLLRCLPNGSAINKQALVELISTGMIVGNETILTEIEFINADSDISPIQYKIIYPKSRSTSKSREEAIEQQVENADQYIRDIIAAWTHYMPNGDLNLSITGGLDSRLLTGLVLKHTHNFSFYSYWRPENCSDLDFKIAQMVANTLDKHLYFKPIKHISEFTDKLLYKQLLNAHDSCDGVIRPGSFWDEEFTLLSYRSSLSPIPYLRLTGFEGEFYRNMERLPIESKRSLESWVRWDMINRFAGFNFTSKKQQHITEERIISHLKHKGYKSLNLNTFKDYYRSYAVPSYRSLQNHIENRAGFIISPFADIQLSEKAKSAHPFIGNSIGFEVDMLNQISSVLAKLPNDYGIDFSKGVNTSMNLTAFIWQLLPPRFKHNLFNLIRRNVHQDEYILKLKKQSRLVSMMIENLKSLDLPVDLEKFSQRSTRGRLLVNLAFFVEHNNKWLK